jgi:hypothetical protein
MWHILYILANHNAFSHIMQYKILSCTQIRPLSAASGFVSGRFPSFFSAVFPSALRFRQPPFDTLRHWQYSPKQRMGVYANSLHFYTQFVWRMALVTPLFLYYNQPKSKEYLHNHSQNYNQITIGGIHFEPK